jgi:Protein of unknown function (DUF1203)
MGFRIRGLSADPFVALYGLSDSALAERGVKRVLVDEQPGFPDRIEMRDAAIGETMLLLNHVSHDVATPYRASHAIFVREGATQTYDGLNELPDVMRRRLLSLRAFDQDGMMLDADVVDGTKAKAIIDRFFANPAIAYIHAHNAKQGCFSGRIDRA